MNRYLRLILINLLVLFILINALDFFSIAFLRIYYLSSYNKNNSSFPPTIAQLPAYKDYKWAKTHFKEFSELKAEYRSYVGWRRLPYKGETININNSGIRLTVCNKTELGAKKTIGFFGGSTMWGTGVNDSLTVPSIISQFDSDYNCINYGESGYRAFQSVQMLLLELAHGNVPDIVVFYDGANNPIISGQRFLSHDREFQINKRLLGTDPYGEQIPSFTSHYLSPTKYLFGKIIKKIHPSRLEYESDSIAAVELLESWLLAKNISESYSITFLCVLQPVAFFGNPKINYLNEHLKNSPYNEEAFNYYNKVKELLEEEKYQPLKESFVDMSMIFNDLDNIYFDWCHVGPQGNRIIAHKLYDVLKRKEIQ